MQSPWHLWGNTQTFTVPGFTIPASNVQIIQRSPVQGQLARVTYGRPESWHFLFVAEVLSGPTPGIDEKATVTIDYDLTVGIGRSSIIMPAFEEQLIQWTNEPPPIGEQLRSTSVIGVRTVVPNTVVTSVIDEITAQDIQLACRVSFMYERDALSPEEVIPPISVAVSGHFAPKNHIRPEWFENPAVFRGQENKTT